MEVSEKELEDIIFHASTDDLFERGIYLEGKTFMQLRIGNYGIADIVTAQLLETDRNRSTLFIKIYELKKEEINIFAFLQALRYVKGIKEYVSIKNPKIKTKFGIVLVGKSIDNSGNGFPYLTDLIGGADEYNGGTIGSVEFYTYELKIDGFYFDRRSGYSLPNNGFNIKTKFKERVKNPIDTEEDDLPF